MPKKQVATPGLDAISELISKLDPAELSGLDKAVTAANKARHSSKTYSKGDVVRVLYDPKEGNYYTGTVEEVKGTRVRIKFDSDGEVDLFGPEFIQLWEGERDKKAKAAGSSGTGKKGKATKAKVDEEEEEEESEDSDEEEEESDEGDEEEEEDEEEESDEDEEEESDEDEEEESDEDEEEEEEEESDEDEEEEEEEEEESDEGEEEEEEPAPKKRGLLGATNKKK